MTKSYLHIRKQIKIKNINVQYIVLAILVAKTSIFISQHSRFNAPPPVIYEELEKRETSQGK